MQPAERFERYLELATRVSRNNRLGPFSSATGSALLLGRTLLSWWACCKAACALTSSVCSYEVLDLLMGNFLVDTLIAVCGERQMGFVFADWACSR